MVRIYKEEYSNNSYNFRVLHILMPRYIGSKDSIESLEIVGRITFQQTKGEESWYGRRFAIDARSVEDFKKFAKVVSKLTDYDDYDTTIADLGKIEYYDYLNGINHYIPQSKSDHILIKVIDKLGYTNRYCLVKDITKIHLNEGETWKYLNQ